MKLLQLIKDFRKWREEKRQRIKDSRCQVCAYNNDTAYMSYCCSCQNSVDDDWFVQLKPITDEAFADIIILRILGNDWCVVEPLTRNQMLAIALQEILKRLKI